MNVRDLMTESPAVCTPDTSLQKVARMMVQNDCGAIPVVKNDQGSEPMGIVTDRDITTRMVAVGENPLQHRAADAMTENAITVRPEDSIEQAAERMEQEQVRRLIVRENGSSVGIIAQADIARRASDDTTGELVEEVSEPSGKASEASGH